MSLFLGFDADQWFLNQTKVPPERINNIGSKLYRRKILTRTCITVAEPLFVVFQQMLKMHYLITKTFIITHFLFFCLPVLAQLGLAL